MEDFIRWSLQYDMWCKMQFFGEAIEKVESEAASEPKRGPRNLLELLPDQFTVQDAVDVRRQQGMDAQGARNMLYQWAHRGYILQLTVDSFSKVKS